MTPIASTVLYKLENELMRKRHTIRSLASEIGVPRREIEKAIQELRTSGHAVCSQCYGAQKGIYIARTEKEAEQFFRQMNSRIRNNFLTLSSVKKCFEPKQKIQLSLFEEVA